MRAHSQRDRRDKTGKSTGKHWGNAAEYTNTGTYTPESKAMTLAKTYGSKNITFVLGPTFSEALMCLQLSFKVRKKCQR